MLGQLVVVKAFAAAIPNVNRLRGPHGIPLINHARAGGPQAAEVLEYPLESLGDLPKTGDFEPLSAADFALMAARGGTRLGIALAMCSRSTLCRTCWGSREPAGRGVR